MPPPFRPPRAAQATPRRQEGGDHSVRVEAERGGGLRRHGGRNGHGSSAVAYGSFLARTASGKQETDAYADA